MTPDEADDIIERAFPMNNNYNEPWRSKSVHQMEDRELQAALNEHVNNAQANRRWFEANQDGDQDDVRWAYESMLRSEKKIVDIQAEIVLRSKHNVV